MQTHAVLYEADLLLNDGMQSWHEQWRHVLLNIVAYRMLHAVLQEADLPLSPGI